MFKCCHRYHIDTVNDGLELAEKEELDDLQSLINSTHDDSKQAPINDGNS